jgi:hypothetical protein
MEAEIRCRACRPEDEGCRRCGGYKVLLVKREDICPKCETSAWVSPGVHTSYEGKRYVTFDGLEMVCHLDRPDNCAGCEEVRK